jgi:hypothetical protein
MQSFYKECSKCGDDKDFDEFSIDNSKKDGLRSECKECRSISRKKQTVTKKVIKPVKKSKLSEPLQKSFANIGELHENLAKIIKMVDEPLCKNVDMTFEVKELISLIIENAHNFDKEYYNIRHPPVDEFFVDETNLISPYDIMQPSSFIPRVQSEVQYKLVQFKQIHSEIDIKYESGVYNFKLSTKLKNEDITILLKNCRIVDSTYTYIG